MTKKNTSKSSNFFDFMRQHPVIKGLLLMCIVGLILLWFIMIFLNVWTHHGDDSTVPEIKHLTYGEAKTRLTNEDLEIEISDSIYDTSYPPGTIVESWPKAGSQVKRGRKVYVTLTAFTPKHVTLSMPVTGVSARQAVSYLNALGVNAVRIINVPSEYPDLVEGAHYDGRPIGVGSVIPVDAHVVLEVGFYQPSSDDEEISEDSEITAEDLIRSDLSNGGTSVYVDDEP